MLPSEFEEGGQATPNELQEVNLGTYKDHQPTFIYINMSLDEKELYVDVLKQNETCFLICVFKNADP